MNSALLSRVRQRPSETERARLNTTACVCSCGSSARDDQCVKAVTTTPVTSSSTTPPLPERERKTFASAKESTTSTAREVAVEDDGLRLLVGERPGDADALRRAEREVEAGHRRGPGRRFLRRPAERLAGHRVAQLDEHPAEVLLCDDAPVFDAAAPVEVGETGAEEAPGRRPRRRVVGGEALGPRRVLVARGDRLHEVAEPAAQADPPDRDHFLDALRAGDPGGRLHYGGSGTSMLRPRRRTSWWTSTSGCRASGAGRVRFRAGGRGVGEG